MKKLAAQTAVYGVSSIFGRFLNWCLAPWYTFVLKGQDEYGIYTNMYAWMALLIVILTYGMETGFFYFVNNDKDNAKKVYSTILWCVFSTSALFAVLACAFSSQLAELLQIGGHGDFIAVMCVTVAIDAFCCIPMAYLRFKEKVAKFALVNISMIAVNIFFNIFFLLICPKLMDVCPGTIDWFYNPDYSVGYVFVANAISTLYKLAVLSPEIKASDFRIDGPMLKKVLKYSLPLLVLGVAGIMNQTLDKIIFPIVYSAAGHTTAEAQAQLGIYGACFKVAMVMMMFTQAFRYAYEPFVFAKNKGEDKRRQYADAMKFYVIFSLLIFLGIVFYLDVLKLIINKSYHEGLAIVPVVLVSYLFQGVYFNLSLWYKLIEKTSYGAVLSIIGFVITLVVNLVGIPLYGYWAPVWATFACFVVITLISYVLGQKYYPVEYDLKTMGLYFVVAMAMFAVSRCLPFSGILYYAFNTLMLIGFMALIFKHDLPISSVPLIGRFFRR